MKKIVLMTGNRPKHFELITTVNETGMLQGIVMDCNTDKKYNGKYYDLYFESEKNSEHKFFGNKYNNISRINTLSIKNNVLFNEIYSFIDSINPDLIILYDFYELEDDYLPSKYAVWKIHEGYINRFKGYFCNFHACIENMPEYICHTLTEYSQNDSGRIIHQTDTKFRPEDNITDKNCRSLRKMIYDLENILNLYNNDKIIFYEQEETESRFYDKNDFREEDIENIIKNNRLLSEKVSDNKKPVFYTQFK